MNIVKTRVDRTRRTTTPKGVHSIRVPDWIWDRAKRKAESHGLLITHVVNDILEGYALDQIEPPEVIRRFK